jgi:2-keto-4-pentenoate hydratase/2-oxohepta-3-ene-1,7-dioic acid hydratase in catechol pathway
MVTPSSRRTGTRLWRYYGPRWERTPGFKLWVNGELRQDFNSGDYIYSVNRAVKFCSQFFTLFPGDVISMGSGPGNAFTWQKYSQVGDRVKVTIEGLGVREFSIAAEA